MYQIKIYEDDFFMNKKGRKLLLTALCETFEDIHNIYWYFRTSAQSINSDLYVQVMNLNTMEYIDIRKGQNQIPLEPKDCCVLVKKDVSFIKEMVRNK